MTEPQPSAPYGYKANGQPRLRHPGPGRSALQLTPEERRERVLESKRRWWRENRRHPGPGCPQFTPEEKRERVLESKRRWWKKRVAHRFFEKMCRHSSVIILKCNNKKERSSSAPQTLLECRDPFNDYIDLRSEIGFSDEIEHVDTVNRIYNAIASAYETADDYVRAFGRYYMPWMASYSEECLPLRISADWSEWNVAKELLLPDLGDPLFWNPDSLREPVTRLIVATEAAWKKLDEDRQRRRAAGCNQSEWKCKDKEAGKSARLVLNELTRGWRLLQFASKRLGMPVRRLRRSPDCALSAE